PLGALNVLVAIASTVASQHGVQSARRVCIELAANNDLWRYIAGRLGTAADVAGPGTFERALEREASSEPILVAHEAAQETRAESSESNGSVARDTDHGATADDHLGVSGSSDAGELV